MRPLLAAVLHGKLPAGLPAEDRRRITLAASVLASENVLVATQGIERHALDVCHTPLL